jgi:hypothetical protein
MTVLRRFGRPSWPVAAGVVAVAVPAIFLVSGGTASGKPPAVQSATPVVERDYIYGQLFDMSYNDVYRVSGLRRFAGDFGRAKTSEDRPRLLTMNTTRWFG